MDGDDTYKNYEVWLSNADGRDVDLFDTLTECFTFIENHELKLKTEFAIRNVETGKYLDWSQVPTTLSN